MSEAIPATEAVLSYLLDTAEKAATELGYEVRLIKSNGAYSFMAVKPKG